MSPERDTVPASYFDSSGRADVLSGGVRLIPVETSKGTFKVWTRRVGNNPTIKVLLLHSLRQSFGASKILSSKQPPSLPSHQLLCTKSQALSAVSSPMAPLYSQNLTGLLAESVVHA